MGNPLNGSPLCVLLLTVALAILVSAVDTCADSDSEFELTPTELVFEELDLSSTTSATKEFEIKNTGSVPLHVSIQASTGSDAFDISSGRLSETVPPGGSVTVSVTFHPLSAGKFEANVHLTSNAAKGNTSGDVKLSGSAKGTALFGKTVALYGKECKEALGALPLTWSCQSGSIIPIDGPGPCSKPPWLKLNGSDGQCIEGARLLKLPIVNPDTQVMVICRRYSKKKDPVNDKMYEDVAVVGHNNKTGKTCFFQALNKTDGMDGTNVPSPMADASDPAERAVANRAASFWKHPDHLNSDALRCSLCHDNDVWMHTPYVDQVTGKDEVPHKKPDSWKGDAIEEANKYSLVEQEFYVGLGWPKPNSVLTAKIRNGNDKVEAQSCTECHRISDQNTKDTFLDWATDNPTDIPDEKKDLKWDQYRWMPQDSDTDNEDEWHKSYDEHIRAMKCCLDHPNYNGCAKMEIFGIDTGSKPVWGEAKNGTCIDDSGNVAFSTAIDSRVVASRGEKDASCDAPLDKPASITFKVSHSKVVGGSDVFTKTKEGKVLGYSVPNDPNSDPAFQLYPGDAAEIALLNTTAWDKGHHLLKFDRWSDADSGGPGDPSACPCEDPGKSTCNFIAHGPADWFGGNPLRPAFLPGDPPSFKCVAQFKIAGDCERPGHGSIPGGKRIGGLVDCDCEHVSFGLLTGAFIDQCKGSDSHLKQLVAEGTFHVEVGPDQKIQSGDLCDPTASGPSAWPVQGGPANPPPKANGPSCHYVGGLVQYQCE
jgi:hypothetical protein